MLLNIPVQQPIHCRLWLWVCQMIHWCASFTATPTAIIQARLKPMPIEVDRNLHIDLHDQDIGPLVSFLASSGSDFITGSISSVDGGYSVSDRFIG